MVLDDSLTEDLHMKPSLRKQLCFQAPEFPLGDEGLLLFWDQYFLRFPEAVKKVSAGFEAQVKQFGNQNVLWFVLTFAPYTCLICITYFSF